MLVKIIYTILFFFSFTLINSLDNKIRLNIKSGTSADKINHLIRSNKGRNIELFFTKGKYYFDNIILLDQDNLTLTAIPKSVSFNLSQKGGILIKGRNIIVSNLDLVGKNQSAKDMYSGYGIMILGATNIKLTNNTFSNISGTNIAILPDKSNGAFNVDITENKFHNHNFKMPLASDNSAILIGYSGKHYMHRNINISYNIIDGSNKLNNGVSVIGHAENINVTNNIISNFLSYGIVMYESDNDPFTLRGNNISYNKITNIGEINNNKTKKGMGIYLMKSHFTNISHNVLQNVLRNSDQSETLATGGIALNGTQGCKVMNNEIVSSNMYGIVTAYSFDTLLEKNKFGNTIKENLYFISNNDLKIYNNIFTGQKGSYIKGFLSNTSSQKDLPSNVRNIDTGYGIEIANNVFDSETSNLEIVLQNKKFKFSDHILIRSNISSIKTQHTINLRIR